MTRIDIHVRLGRGREVGLDLDGLLGTMSALEIDHVIVSPGEYGIAWDNDAGNAAVASAAASSSGRIFAYAVANPWRSDAIAVLDRARDAGAVALALDPALQGFDLLDGLADPLVEFAAASGWFVYVRTGTPPHALPLPLASFARRHSRVRFVMGRSGATDFWIDAAPALRYASNLYADTSYAPWDTVLAEFARDPEIGAGRVVFSTDSPYTVPAAELRRVLDWPITPDERADVLGGTVRSWLDGVTSAATSPTA